jgi:hypothetical protein
MALATGGVRKTMPLVVLPGLLAEIHFSAAA